MATNALGLAITSSSIPPSPRFATARSSVSYGQGDSVPPYTLLATRQLHHVQRRLTLVVRCDAAPGNAPKGENGAARGDGSSGNGAKGGNKAGKNRAAEQNVTLSNGGGSRQPEEQIWGRRRLSDLEREILGVQRGDGVPASPKDAPSASPKPSSASASGSARPQLRRRDPNNANQKSLLDELDEQGFGQIGAGLEEWEAIKSAKRMGEWLEEKTVRKEGEEESMGPPMGFSLVLLLGIFPTWLFLTLVAGGWLELPPQLSSLQDLLTTP